MVNIPATNWAARMAAATASSDPGWLQFVPDEVRGLVRSHLPGFLRDGGAPAPAPSTVPHVEAAPGAGFTTRSFSNAAGTRLYKLHVPAGYQGQPVPLIIMLHGCTQSPDGFAAATGMNAVADSEVCIVAYPGQSKSEHGQRCWKWFSPGDQMRGAGEPAIIAGITREIMRDYAIDPSRVFVAGFSAGGAMAAIMGETYPDLYAAVAVHSGLARGAAHTVPAALAAMKQGGGAHLRSEPADAAQRATPIIVFHGDADRTVSPRNGDDVVARACGRTLRRSRTETGQSSGGRRYTRAIHTDSDGRPMIEHWVIHDAGHAWAGGQAENAFTDPAGPDATSEMMRFFRDHPMTGA